MILISKPKLMLVSNKIQQENCFLAKKPMIFSINRFIRNDNIQHKIEA